jgi:PAS domain S-box-containing protein
MTPVRPDRNGQPENPAEQEPPASAAAREIDALRRSEVVLRDFIETSTIGLHWVGEDGTILWANQADLDLLGYTKDEYLGENIAAFHADQPVINEILSRLTRGEKLRDYPARLRHRDGSIRHVLINSSVLFEEGKFIHTRCFTRDVTALTKEQEAGALLGAIVDSTDDAIISKDLSGRITSWNRSAERIFGYTAAEAVGQSIMMLIPPDRQGEEPKILARLQRGERVDHFETIRRRKDGTLLNISLTISPVRDRQDRIVGASKIARDITERKRAEEQRAQLSAIVDSSGDAIYIYDFEGTIRTWNRAAEELYGYRQEEIVGRHVDAIVPPDAMVELREIISPAIAAGQIMRNLETTRRRRDGQVFPAVLTLSPVRDDKGKAVAISVIARDVTESKRAEDELRRANQDLEQFAFSASHDLQEPLRTIKIYSELLAERHAEMVEGESAEFLDYLRRAATRMEMLVRDLLSYTQVTTLAMPVEETDTNESLSVALGNLGGAITESGAQVTFENLPRLRAHSTHVRQLFQNLVGNAIKYRSADRTPVVHIRAAREGGAWVFTVVDNGIGIEPQYKEKIFGLFTRLHNTERYEGTGIGLAICQRIVDRYHGRIWVESEPGKGSEFRFTLPV